MKNIFSKIKIWFSDQYHLLFHSAADNHLRIQRCSDGSYQCLIRFDSYTELKRYQKKFRRLTVSLSSAVAMMAIAFVIAPYVMNPNKSSANSFTWVQSNWGNGTSSANASKAGWTNYFSKDSGLTASASGVTLITPSPSTTGDANFTNATVSAGMYKADLGGNYSANGALLTLKKVTGASCASGNVCVSNNCVANTCVVPCDANTTCGETCAYNGDVYKTVSIGSGANARCWFAENLRTSARPNGTNISSGVYCSVGCGSPWGKLYTWATAMDLQANSCDTVSCASLGASKVGVASGAKIQGICPTGWHIPSDYNVASDDMGLLSAAASSSSGPLKLYDTTYTFWSSPNAGASATNLGFNAVGAGYYQSGLYTSPGYGYFWTSAEYNATKAWNRYFYSSATGITRDNSYIAKSYGISVRCVKN